VNVLALIWISKFIKRSRLILTALSFDDQAPDSNSVRQYAGASIIRSVPRGFQRPNIFCSVSNLPPRSDVTTEKL